MGAVNVALAIFSGQNLLNPEIMGSRTEHFLPYTLISRIWFGVDTVFCPASLLALQPASQPAVLVPSYQTQLAALFNDIFCGCFFTPRTWKIERLHTHRFLVIVCSVSWHSTMQ